jgi:hypothetical protein
MATNANNAFIVAMQVRELAGQGRRRRRERIDRDVFHLPAQVKESNYLNHFATG